MADLGAYKWEKFISHSFGGWEVPDRGTSRFWIWWRGCFLGHRWASFHYNFTWLQAFFFFFCFNLTWQKVPESCLVSFTRALIPFMRAPTSDLTTSERPHLQLSLHWELGFQHTNFGGYTYSVYINTVYHKFFGWGKKNHLITLKQVPLPAIPIVEDKQAEMVKTPNSFSFEKRATELGWKQHLTSAVLRVPAPP